MDSSVRIIGVAYCLANVISAGIAVVIYSSVDVPSAGFALFHFLLFSVAAAFIYDRQTRGMRILLFAEVIQIPILDLGNSMYYCQSLIGAQIKVLQSGWDVSLVLGPDYALFSEIYNSFAGVNFASVLVSIVIYRYIRSLRVVSEEGEV